MSRQQRNRAWREGGGYGSALIFPLFAVTEQQAVAEQRAQHAHGGRGAPVIVGILDKDVANGGGPTEDDLLTPKKAADDRLLFEGLWRERQQGIVA